MKRCPKNKQMRRCRKNKQMRRCTKNKEESKSRSLTKSWADLDLDLLGEIKKKLYWGDHARFSGVCKNWLAAEHGIRAGDVLPWVMNLYPVYEVNTISYDLYEPHNLDQPIISRALHLTQFFDISRIISTHKSILYLDGCLFLSMPDMDNASIHFLLVSIPTDRAITIPQFHYPGVPNSSVFKAVSTYPFSPDCVFLALHVDANNHIWSIGIFRHGDTQWTSTIFECFARPFLYNVVCIAGVFYFMCYDNQLAAYDIVSGDLKLQSFLTPLYYGGIIKFFHLDGELMLFFYDIKIRKFFLTSYDWSQNLWVPLNNLGGRSLFLGRHSVYVDAINYYQVSGSKIYLINHDSCCVYSFENGEVLESPSSGLRNWDALDFETEFSLWVEPPHLLPK